MPQNRQFSGIVSESENVKTTDSMFIHIEFILWSIVNQETERGEMVERSKPSEMKTTNLRK